MEYQKIANLLVSASNKPSKFRTRNFVEINYDIRGAYSPNKQIKFKTTTLKSSLCDVYIHGKRNISINNTAAAAPFTNCISKKNNTQIDNAEYNDIVMR